MAALGHVFVVQGFYRERRLRRDTPEPSSLFPRASGPVVGLASLAVHGALLLNAAEVAFHGIFAPYLCALMWDLCIGAFFFIRLVRFT